MEKDFGWNINLYPEAGRRRLVNTASAVGTIGTAVGTETESISQLYLYDDVFTISKTFSVGCVMCMRLSCKQQW